MAAAGIRGVRRLPAAMVLGGVLLAAAGQARTLVVDNRNTGAADTNPGTAEAPFRTISAAARQASAGDTVLVHAGLYRERVTPVAGGEPGRPLTFMAAPGDTVIVRGSDEVERWTPVDGAPGVFSTPVEPLGTAAFNPYRLALRVSPGEKPGELQTPARPARDAHYMPLTLGLVFAGGAMLREVRSEQAVAANPMAWTVAADGTRLLANFGHARLEDVPRPIELAVRPRLFAPNRRGLGYLVVRGFTFEHCANPGPFPSLGAVAVRAGHHWVIEHNTIRFAKCNGLDAGNEHWNPRLLDDCPPEDRVRMQAADNVIRNNTVSDHGIVGMNGLGSERLVVTGNLVERNAWLDLDESDVEWAEWGGIKFHSAARVEGNVVRDNEGYGIWLDNIRGGRVTRNVVVNNKGAGIFTELGTGPILVDNNLVAMTRHLNRFYGGTGIYAHDVSGLTVAHNLVTGNAGAGIEVRVVTGRKIDGREVAADGTAVLNNIILDNARVAISLPAAGPRSQGLRSDWNLLAGNHEYSQGMGPGWPALFAINRFALGFDYSQVRAKADAVRAQRKQPALPADWQRNPVLDLAAWQGVMEMDLHSREAPLAWRTQVRARALAVRVDNDGSLAGFRCPPVPGVDRDLAGAGMPGGEVAPGPFQSVPAGRSELVLPFAGACP